MFDVNAWLNEDIKIKPRYEAERTIPRHEWLCWLIVANGSLRVTSWGFLGTGFGGHQLGLEQEDALDLMQYSSFLLGLAACGVDWSSALKPYYDAYIAKYKQIEVEQKNKRVETV